MYTSNGFIVQMEREHIINGINYQGINNYSWPLIDSNICNNTVKEVQERIDDAQFNPEAIILLTNVEHVKAYVQACRDVDLSCRILYCEAEYSAATVNLGLHQGYAKETNFIGYDYADRFPDYHSCIANELLYHSYMFQSELINRLNEYGLFNNRENVDKFILAEKDARRNNKAIYFEKGAFVIYKLFTVPSPIG